MIIVRLSARVAQLFALFVIAILLGLIGASRAQAQSVFVDFLDIPGPYTGPNSTNNGPLLSPQTYNLPGYGPVIVSWTAPTLAALPAVGSADFTTFYNQSTTSVPPYTWGTDVQGLVFFRTGTPSNYSVSFTFPGLPPDLDRLVFVANNLGRTGNGSTVLTLSEPLSTLGHYQPTPSPLVNTLVGVNAIQATGSGGTNSGYSLFDVTPSALTLSGGQSVLTVGVSHIIMDQMSFSIGYRQESSILKICKVAGEGVPTGTPFTFNNTSPGLPDGSVSVPAGPGPGGWCAVAGTYPEGSDVVVTELPSGFTVIGIDIAPPQNGTADIAAGQATVQVGPGVTEVTFTNELQTGYLEVCKTGEVTGTYSFTVDGVAGSVDVPAGACSPALLVNAGTVTITETTPGAVMIACSTLPAANQIACDPATLISTVTVAQGDVSTQTIAFIENDVCVPTPTVACPP